MNTQHVSIEVKDNVTQTDWDLCSGMQTFWRAGAKRKKRAHTAHSRHWRGHFNVRFGSQEGTLAHVFANQEGSLSCYNQPRGQFSVYCQPREHFSVCFCHPKGHFSARFGSQEGTLAYVFSTQEGTLASVLAPKRAHHWISDYKGNSFNIC